MEKRTISVLVIAADEHLRAEACELLTRRGCLADAVKDGSAARARLVSFTFDAIVEHGGELWTVSHPGASRSRPTRSGSLSEAVEAVVASRSSGERGERAGDAERATRTTAVPRYSGTHGRAMRLLLVDDSEVTLELAQSALRQSGFDVRIAMRSAEALALVQTWRPDVAVIDLRRPDVEGRPLTAALKDVGVGLVFVSSSLTEAELHRASREAFADGYVSKARGVKVFVARIEELVKRGSAGTPERKPAGSLE